MVVLTTFSQPTEGIRHRQPNITAYVNDNNLGKGTLYIAESCLSWISDAGDGFSIEYSNISLHAVSRDLAAFSQECLFLMLDIALGDEKSENGDSNDESDDVETTTELRFVPDDRGMLDAMFHAMNVCQALHPDPEDSISDEDLYEVTDDDIQMEDADYGMANLDIQEDQETISLNNKNTVFGLRGIEVRDMEDDRQDMVEEEGEGEVDRGVGRLVVEDMGVGRLVVEDMGVDRVVEEDMGEGRGVDRLVEEDMGEGRGVDRLVEDMGEGKGVDRGEDRMVKGDIREGEGEDRMVYDTRNIVLEERVGEAEAYRAQDDKLFVPRRADHENNLQYVQSSHMASHFSDAES